MTRRLTFLIVSVVQVLFFTRFALSQDDWIQQSIDLTINARFDSAESVVRPHCDNNEERLAAWFYLASIYNSKMAHFENYHEAAPFLSALDSVQKFSEQELNRQNLPEKLKAQYLFYRGSALGYKAFYEGRIGRWLAALEHGLSSVSDLKQAVRLDSTLYEAYLGIGIYQYWRSIKLKYLLWTPFFSDLREQGIANIKKAVRYSKHSRYLAMHQLIYVLANYHHFDEAWQYAQQAVAAYPQSPFMRWAYAHTLFMMHKNQQAAMAFNELLKMLSAEPQMNPVHLLTCHVRLAEIYLRLGQNQKCRQQLKLIRAFSKEELSDEAKKEWDKARTLWRSCAEGGDNAAAIFR